MSVGGKENDTHIHRMISFIHSYSLTSSYWWRLQRAFCVCLYCCLSLARSRSLFLFLSLSPYLSFCSLAAVVHTHLDDMSILKTRHLMRFPINKLVNSVQFGSNFEIHLKHTRNLIDLETHCFLGVWLCVSSIFNNSLHNMEKERYSIHH